MANYIFSVFLTFVILTSLSPSSLISCKKHHRHNHHNPNHYHAHKYEKIYRERSNEIDSSEEGQLDQHGRWIPSFKFPKWTFPTMPPMPSWTFPTMPPIFGYTMPTIPPVPGFTFPTMPPIPSFETPDLNVAFANLKDAMHLGKINGNWLLDEIVRVFIYIVRGLRLHQIDFKDVQLFKKPPVYISGYFSGLDTIKRSGDFTVQIGKKTEFRAGLEIDHLHLHLELMENGRRRSINITYEDLKCIAHIEINFGESPPKVSFSDFQISIGKMSGDFRTGIQFIDAPLNAHYKVLDVIKAPLLQVLSFGLKEKFNGASTKLVPVLAKLGWTKGVEAISTAFG